MSAIYLFTDLISGFFFVSFRCFSRFFFFSANFAPSELSTEPHQRQVPARLCKSGRWSRVVCVCCDDGVGRDIMLIRNRNRCSSGKSYANQVAALPHFLCCSACSDSFRRFLCATLRRVAFFLDFRRRIDGPPPHQKKNTKKHKKKRKKNEAHPHGVVFSPVFPAAVIGAFYRLIATITRSDDIVDYRRRNKSADGCRSKKTNGISTTITSSNVVLFGFIRVRNEFMKLINNFSMISNISESRRF